MASRLRALASRLAAANEKGNVFLAVGVAGLGASAALSWRERSLHEDRRALTSVRMEVATLQKADEEQRAQRRTTAEAFSDAPPLWQASVARGVHPKLHFDGPLALPSVAVGQAVDVLEEDTGPSQGYHRCRNEFGEGLYPKNFLVRQPTKK